ncbi:MAG: DUF3883 domain-containing protein [Syntrophales bacterium]|jgi:hypothetical protein|nr:DUF3883 domain-containing protein [Syntrophales bacterium]MDX9922761.1 DUF3883 domain-containing protein [Syntrophales bacterium]
MIGDIKDANTLEEVQQIRQRQVEIERAGGDHDGIQRILTEDMYSNPARFIDELLQNAQDAARKAAKHTDVIFRLSSDKLELTHSGKDFDLKDVISITGIGVSTKKNDDIGTFGIGFKSVYQITDEPHIYSGTFHFKIVEFRIPISLPRNDNIHNTSIVLPFKKGFEQEIIYSYLNEIEFESILFLPNIDSITWHEDEKTTKVPCLSKISLDEIKGNDLNYKKVEIRNALSGESKQYLVFQRKIQIGGKNLDIDIVYGYDPVQNRIIPLKNRKLHVYFPTTEETHLNFLLNAPFRTTANRENIKLENNEDASVLEELSRLAADSILFIQKQYPNLLNVSFYSNIIPLKEDIQNKIYRIFFETIKSFMINPKNRLLPVQNSGFAAARDVLMAENSSLIELLNATDTEQLFGRQYWINSEITSTKESTRDVHRYLKEHLNVEDIGFEKFAKLFTKKFIKRKNDQWITSFYQTLLTNQKRLWQKNPWEIHPWDNQTDGIWKKRPIIRLSDNKHVNPYDEQGNPHAWLPSESKPYFDVVKPALTKDEQAKQFLTSLGLKRPNKMAEFKKYIAPTYADEGTNVELDKYLEDILMAREAYREYRNEPDENGNFVDTMKSLFLIKSQNVNTGNVLFRKPNEVYLPNKELEIWFKGNNQAYFVYEEICRHYANEKNDFEGFLSAIGVSNQIKYIEPLKINKQIYRCEDYHKYVEFEPREFRPDFYIEGLDYALDNINIGRSKIIWNIALTKVTHITTCKIRSALYQRSLRGNYDNDNPREIPKEKTLESKVGKYLKERYWLYDRQGNLIQRLNSEIALEDLHGHYDRDHDNVSKLVQALGLKPETYTKEQVDRLLSKKEAELSQKDAQIKQLKIKLSEYEKKKSTKIPIREYKTKDTEIRRVPEPNTFTPTGNRGLNGLENQTPGTEEDSEDNEHQGTGYNRDNGEMDSQVNKKIYGRWAEEYVVWQLYNKYKDVDDIIIEWLNEKSEKGRGYDIRIKKDNKAIEFIEVKGKVSNKPELFEVTETQFRFAGKAGEKYFFYIVSNVKSKEIKIEMVIQNPIKQWRESKLIASSVKFKI